MLTQCPNCQTIYQISAGELGAAKGFVECGECGTQFNALDRIADEPQFDSQPAAVTSSEPQEIKPAPTFVLMEESSTDPTELVKESIVGDSPKLIETSGTDDIPMNISQTTELLQAVEPEQAIAETQEHDKTLELAVLSDEQPIEQAVPANTTAAPIDEQVESESTGATFGGPVLEAGSNASPSLAPEEHDILFSEPLSGSTAESAVVSEQHKIGTEEGIDFDEVPPILQEEMLAMQQPKNSGANVFWVACALLLLIGICVQAAWHYRLILMERFPTAVPYAERACAIVGCELNYTQTLEPIQLVSRDVRTHPRYENALLVNASMVNSGAETISFPTVQLGLFDPTGTAIGIRQFSPAEYLDKSIQIDNGIPPGRSVHVVLELANTGDDATSFEFSFH